MGDRVLQAFVEYMKHEIRPTDHIFRYGGEEFILYCQNQYKRGRNSIK